MIKLIATDLDGTLLNREKKLPDDIFDVIDALDKKGILFAAASGRQMASLERLFAPVREKMIFIAENGAYVKYKDEEIAAEIMDKFLIRDMVRKIKDRPNFRFLIEGRNMAYTDHETMYKAMTSRKFNYNVTLVEDTEDVFSIKDDIIKAALSDVTTNKRSDFGEMHTFFNDRCTAVLSGDNCLDFQNTGVNKGSAIKKIKNRFGMEKSEIISFGDNFNDLEMLEESGKAFIMENSPEDMKTAIKAEIIGTNEECAVTEKIKNLVLRG